MTYRAIDSGELSAKSGLTDREIYYREILRLRLEEGDLEARFRQVQKIKYVVDGAPVPEPGMAALESFHKKNAHLYRIPHRISFEHVFFSRNSSHDAEARCAAAQSVVAAGDSTPADEYPDGATFSELDELETAREFGRAFARATFALDEGSWSEPIVSIHGCHLVRIVKKHPVRDAELSEVMEQVRRDYLDQARAQAAASAWDDVARHHEPTVRL